MKLLPLLAMIYFFSCLQQDRQEYQIVNEPQPGEMRGIHMKDMPMIKQANDTIKKYGLSDVNDFFRKIIYGINGFCPYEGNDTLNISMCKVVLIDLKRISKSKFLFGYYIFDKDSLAVLWPFEAGCFRINSFEYDYKKNRLIKTYIGQESSTIAGDGILEIYREKIATDEFKINFGKYYKFLDPEFVRLMGDSIKMKN